jgi:hypothetical protein
MLCPLCGRPRTGDAFIACSCSPAADSSAPAAGKPRRHRLPLRSLSGPRGPFPWKLLAASLLGAVIVTGGVFWLCSQSASARLIQEGYFDEEVVIPPGGDFGYLVIIGPISSHYSFSVTPLNGRAVMAVGRVDDGDTDKPASHDLNAVLTDAVTVETGTTKTESGEMTRGRYRWVVVNPGRTPLRAKIRFG